MTFAGLNETNSPRAADRLFARLIFAVKKKTKKTNKIPKFRDISTHSDLKRIHAASVETAELPRGFVQLVCTFQPEFANFYR